MPFDGTQVNWNSLTAVKEVRSSLSRFSWNAPKINRIICRCITRNFSQIEEQAQYGVHCSHIHETLHGVTRICGRLLYRILSNLDDKFTAHGQNSVRALGKVWLWPHPLYTKPEAPQRRYVAIFCTELNHSCSSNAGSTESSFRALRNARLSLSRFSRKSRFFSNCL